MPAFEVLTPLSKDHIVDLERSGAPRDGEIFNGLRKRNLMLLAAINCENDLPGGGPGNVDINTLVGAQLSFENAMIQRL
ncbi:MAG: hypothetical protein AB7V13_19000, partial [Pseudorhodoplanes sp.]